MEVSQLPDCNICASPLVKDIEKRFRRKHKILPIAVEFAPQFNRPVATMRLWLTQHFENLHRKYRLAQKRQEQEVIAQLEDQGISFDDYRDRALKKAMSHLENPLVMVRPTDIAALENVANARQKLGLEKEALKLRMASIYGGFVQGAVEGEVVEDGSKGILPEGQK